MEEIFCFNQQKTQVSYGLPLKQSVPEELAENRHVLLFTNQKYYDRSFEKISLLFKKALDIDWYICRNHLYCNNLDEFGEVLAFLQSFPHNQKYLFVAYGNEGVMELTGFLQQVSSLPSDFCCLPVSLRSFAKGLVSKRKIVSQEVQNLLTVQQLPKAIFFDQTIVQEQADGKLVDFLLLLRSGLVADGKLLKSLYQNFPDSQSIASRSLASYLGELLTSYQSLQTEIEEYGRIFEMAFYDLNFGHLLSANMKRMMGIIFHLLWNDEVTPMDMDVVKFCHWLKRLGFPIDLPKQILLSDYTLAVMKLAEVAPPINYYQKVGQLKGSKYPTSQELLKMIATYQKIGE